MKPEIDTDQVTRCFNGFSTMPGWNTTTNKPTAARLLESDFVFCNGDIRFIRSKHLGCGVYRVFTEPSP